MHCVVGWALPVDRGGSGRAAVVIDNDFRFSERRLRTILESRVSGAALDETVKRIAFARCPTTLEFLAAVELISHGDDAGVLVAVDTVGAFFWREDKLAAEQLAPPSFTPACMRLLAKLLREEDALVLAAKSALFRPRRRRPRRRSDDNDGDDDDDGDDNNNNADDDNVEDPHEHPPSSSLPSSTNPEDASEHEEYMPKEWTKLVKRRVELHTAEQDLFSFRLWDVGPERRASLRERWTFRVADAGLRDWRKLS
mmetsp:Transcript_20725/g.64031  ORF Transcript_20725/g.64031 Transcript_20725/m.64031 type:complete len:254 (-) Transcript_20725:277-1038(-)